MNYRWRRIVSSGNINGLLELDLTAQLAYEYAIPNIWAKRVLVIDLDPQFNVSQLLIGAAKHTTNILNANATTIWNVFEQHTKMPGTSVLPPLGFTPKAYHAFVRFSRPDK